MCYEKGLWIVAKVAFFVLGTFVFSVVFWGTKYWLECGCKKKKK